MNIAKTIIKFIITISFIFYPFIIYLALSYQYVTLAIFYLIMLFVFRLILMPNAFSQLRSLVKITASIGITLACISWLFTKYKLLLFYPVAVNLILLTVFSHSLSQPQTIIEKFARIKHPQLQKKAIKYTRKVTIYWCVFFLFNGLIALTTCLIGNIYWWTLYNGLISYTLIGLFMGIEWIIRLKVQH